MLLDEYLIWVEVKRLVAYFVVLDRAVGSFSLGFIVFCVKICDFFMIVLSCEYDCNVGREEGSS